MMIKICGITNIPDGLVAAESGASAIGLNFYAKSPRYVSAAEAAAISAELPPGVLKVGVFVNESPSEIERIAEVARLDVVQLHGQESPEHLPQGRPIWKAGAVRGDTSVAELLRFPADAYLLDTPSDTLHGGTGQTFDWTPIRHLSSPIILAGGLGPDNVAEAITVVRPWGVDACSRLERAPGLKDHARVRDFISAARSAFSQTASELVSL